MGHIPFLVGGRKFRTGCSRWGRGHYNETGAVGRGAGGNDKGLVIPVFPRGFEFCLLEEALKSHTSPKISCRVMERNNNRGDRNSCTLTAAQWREKHYGK